MKKAILIPTVSLFLICLVAAALLGVANAVTEEKIEQNAIATEEASRKIVMKDAVSFGEKEEGTFTYDETTAPYSSISALDSNGNIIGYVFITESTGYGGKIRTMTGIDTSGKVTGVEFLEIGETVGLGMNATKQTFKDQFGGLIKGITVNKNTPGENEIKALTGATITSKATTKGVNTALAIFEEKIEKGDAANG